MLVFLSRAGPFNPSTGATPSALICVVCLAWVHDARHWCGMGLSQSHFQRLLETFPLAGKAVRPDRVVCPRTIFRDLWRLSLSQAGLFDPIACTSLFVVLSRAGPCNPEHRYSVLAFLSRAGPFNPSTGTTPSALICVVCLAWVQRLSEISSDFQRRSDSFRDLRSL